MFAVRRGCPYCATPIDVRASWSLAPKTRYGLPSGVLAIGTPAVRCSGCRCLVVLRTWHVVTSAIVWWVVLLAAAIWISVAWKSGDSRNEGIGILLAVAVGTAGQWYFAPFLVRLDREMPGEEVNVLNDRVSRAEAGPL